MADRSLLAVPSLSRERKRANNAADRTSAGTASSTAALIVQRPSPESSTKPEYLESAGYSASAEEVRSSSQELITLPAPHLGDVGQVDVVAALFRNGLGVDLLQDVEALGIGLHEAVLDTVVDHLHEVAGAYGTAMEISLLDAGVALLAARRPGDRAG